MQTTSILKNNTKFHANSLNTEEQYKIPCKFSYFENDLKLKTYKSVSYNLHGLMILTCQIVLFKMARVCSLSNSDKNCYQVKNCYNVLVAWILVVYYVDNRHPKYIQV